MKKKLYLHIGIHKTASTSIQEAVKRTLGDDREADYIFPVKGRAGQYSNHSNIAWGLKDDVRFDTRAGGIEAVVAECLASGRQNAIVSGEELEFLVQENVDRLADALREHFDVTVVAYIRRQDEVIRSEYTEWLKTGLTYDNFAAFWRGHAMHIRYDYGHLLTKWRNSFGEENVIFRPFGKKFFAGGSPVTDFFSLCGLRIPDAGLADIRLNTAPTAWSVTAMKLGIHYYEALKGEESNFVAHLTSRHDYATYDYKARYRVCNRIEALARDFDNNPRPFTGFVEGEQQECLAQFAPVNQQFLDMLKGGVRAEFEELLGIPVGQEQAETPLALSSQACEAIFDLVRREVHVSPIRRARRHLLRAVFRRA